MRFQNFLLDKYIGIDKKKKEKDQTPLPETIQFLLNKINKELKRCEYEFTLLPEKKYTSPSSVLKIDKRKLDRLLKIWMESNEELEEIKQQYLNGLHS